MGSREEVKNGKGEAHRLPLFPGHPALEERKRWAAAVDYPGANPPVPRVTLTLPVINQGRCVLFLAGEGKEPVIRAIRDEPERAVQLPAAGVRPAGASTRSGKATGTRYPPGVQLLHNIRVHLAGGAGR